MNSLYNYLTYYEIGFDIHGPQRIKPNDFGNLVQT